MQHLPGFPCFSLTDKKFICLLQHVVQLFIKKRSRYSSIQCPPRVFSIRCIMRVRRVKHVALKQAVSRHSISKLPHKSSSLLSSYLISSPLQEKGLSHRPTSLSVWCERNSSCSRNPLFSFCHLLISMSHLLRFICRRPVDLTVPIFY